MRLLIGDRVKAAVNERIGEGDGTNVRFQASMYPFATGAGSDGPTGHVTVLLTGSTALTSTYVISGANGQITFNATNKPGAGHSILVTYNYNALTSGELSDILSGHTGEPYLAAANACMVIAADASRLFSYSMGDKSVDKRRVAFSLREQSTFLENKHYRQRDDNKFSGTVMTFKDDTGTYYDEYDTAVAYLTGTS